MRIGCGFGLIKLIKSEAIMKRFKSVFAFVFVGVYLSLIGLSAASIGADVVAAQTSSSVAAVAMPSADEQVSVGLVDSITDKIPDWIELAAAIVGLASMIAAVTPTAKDDGVIAVVRKVIDLLAFNFGSARNAKPDKNNWLIK